MFWLYLFLIVAPIEWTAAAKKWHHIRIITKPLSLILLILWFAGLGGFETRGWWIGTGLVFSLAGDIFLLLRRRFFIVGLFAFLFAHVCYISGFLQGKFVFSWALLLPVTAVVILVVVAYPKIVGGVRRRLDHRRLLIPVILYMVTMTTMLLSAGLTWFRPEWGFSAALSVSLGALLFTISDSVLAAGRFLRPIPYSNFLVMFTYHLGQAGITAAILLANSLI